MSGFSISLDTWITRTKKNTNKAIRKIALDLSARIIQATPVDTGRARANWMLGIGTPDLSTSSDEDKSGHTTTASVMSGLENYNYESGHSIFITNSLPYIARLENGHSKQAPNGMVKIALAEYSSLIFRT